MYEKVDKWFSSLEDLKEYKKKEKFLNVEVQNILETTKFLVEILEKPNLTKEDLEENKKNIILDILKEYILQFLDEFNNKNIEDNTEKLEDLENIIYTFINWIKDKDWNFRQEPIKELYHLFWVFYEEIWEYKKALESYENWVQTSLEENYIFYWNISKLYFEKKISWISEDQSLQLAIKNADLYNEKSYENWDFLAFIDSLENLWDILGKIDPEEAKNYYSKILKNLEVNKIFDKEIIIRVTKKIINLTDDELQKAFMIQELLNYNKKDLLFLWEYYEKEGNLVYAFFNYLKAFEEKKDWAKEKLLFFLENTLINKIIEENEEINFLENEEVYEEIQELAKQKNIDLKDIKNWEFEIKAIELAIKNLKNRGYLLREDKANIFLNSLKSDFLENIDSYSILEYINHYQQKFLNSEIFLSEIIDYLSRQDFIDDFFKKELEIIYKKIYNKKELTDFDLKIIFDILELKNNKKERVSYIKEKIFSWKKLTENDEYFILNETNFSDLYWNEYNSENYTKELNEIWNRVFGG